MNAALRQHHAFVNALRGCLGLEPLYDRDAHEERGRLANTFARKHAMEPGYGVLGDGNQWVRKRTRPTGFWR